MLEYIKNVLSMIIPHFVTTDVIVAQLKDDTSDTYYLYFNKQDVEEGKDLHITHYGTYKAFCIFGFDCFADVMLEEE